MTASVNVGGLISAHTLINMKDGEQRTITDLFSSTGPQGPQGPIGPQGPQGIQGPSGITSVRQKSEVVFTGLSLVIPTTETSLLELIKALPHTGSLAPFFNTTTNKFTVFNENSTTTFKINITGLWSGVNNSRSMTVDFPGSLGNTLITSRDAQVTVDIVSLPTFFSVDKNGNLATNGSDITIKSNGAVFTASSIVLIAEQMVPSA